MAIPMFTSLTPPPVPLRLMLPVTEVTKLLLSSVIPRLRLFPVVEPCPIMSMVALPVDCTCAPLTMLTPSDPTPVPPPVPVIAILPLIEEILLFVPSTRTPSLKLPVLLSDPCPVSVIVAAFAPVPVEETTPPFVPLLMTKTP